MEKKDKILKSKVKAKKKRPTYQEEKKIKESQKKIRESVKIECLNDHDFTEYKEVIRGRPTKYEPWMDEYAVYFLQDGKSIVELAAKLKINISTIYEWKNKNPSFSEALSLGMTLCQSWWEREGRISLRDKDFNNGLWRENIKGRFKQDWGESKKEEGNENEVLSAIASFVMNNNNGLITNAKRK